MSLTSYRAAPPRVIFEPSGLGRFFVVPRRRMPCSGRRGLLHPGLFFCVYRGVSRF
ncbi:conserved hypothetical protein [Rhizobium sp. EC-SD404]|nr:conserved hypothetical protein [Rhizobium sp. EC-SD404]